MDGACMAYCVNIIILCYYDNKLKCPIRICVLCFSWSVQEHSHRLLTVVLVKACEQFHLVLPLLYSASHCLLKGERKGYWFAFVSTVKICMCFVCC